MKTLKRYCAELVMIGLTLFILALGTVNFAHANPGGFPPGAKTANATTTVAYVGIGLATSTVTYDAYNISGTNEPTTGVVSDTDSASLLVQFAGSSTSAVLNISYEFSQDGIDWYRDSTSISTSTIPENVNLANSLSWTFTGTPSGGIAGTVATTSRIFTVLTPTRYVRAVFSLTGAAGAVWAQFVPKKQQP